MTAPARTAELVVAIDLMPGDILFRDGRDITVTHYPAAGGKGWIIRCKTGTGVWVLDVGLGETMRRVCRGGAR